MSIVDLYVRARGQASCTYFLNVQQESYAQKREPDNRHNRQCQRFRIVIFKSVPDELEAETLISRSSPIPPATAIRFVLLRTLD